MPDDLDDALRGVEGGPREAIDVASGNLPLYTVRVRPVGNPERLEDVTEWDAVADDFPNEVLLTSPDPTEQDIQIKLAEKLDRLPSSIRVKATRDYVGLAPH